MADDFKYDVFVSYSSANKEWVRKTFVPILENAGLKVCDYYRDFDVGAPIVMEMERAILESKKTIPIFSPAYLKSGWTEFESLMFQTLDAANRNRRVLPVMFENCELPLRIKYMNCINFVNPDDIEIEWQRLSRALEVNLSPSIFETKLPDTSTPESWNLKHPYPMPPNFTGRVAERAMLTQWLNEDSDNRLFILRALGGFGKSALTWHWLTHDVDLKVWKKVIFWSFYEGDSSFESFVKETLEYLKIEIPEGQRNQVDESLKALQKEKVLLIMDGFERVLRAYSNMSAPYQGDEEPKLEENQFDCVNPNAEIFLKGICSLPNVKSKVLMTTRLTPRAVKPRREFIVGCKEFELTAMQKEDAVEFFKKQGIKGNHTEIESACAPYGYHPLSLRILAGYILKDFEKPADITAAQKQKIDGDIIQQKNHVMKSAYDALLPDRQKLLCTIACFRSPVELKTLEAIFENISSLKDNLQDLIERGLLHFDNKNKTFDLHPIVRRFAYERLTTKDRTSAHERLVNYFEEIPEPEKVEKIEDLMPIIELYHHMVRAGNLDQALNLFYDRLEDQLFFQFGAYQLRIELLSVLFLDGIDKPPRLKTKDDQAWTLNAYSASFAMIGQPSQSVSLLEMNLIIREKQNKKISIAIVLNNMATQQLIIGALTQAEQNLRRSIDLCQEINSEDWKGVGHQELGRVLAYREVWKEAQENLIKGQELLDKFSTNYRSVNWSYLSLHFLLMARAVPESRLGYLDSAIQAASRALEIADEMAKIEFPYPVDYMRVYWLLGEALRKKDELDKAEQNLSKAINICRQVNMTMYEADILLAIAGLRYAQKNYEEAKTLADEALTITERCGYVLQGADVNLFLSQYSLEQEKDKVKAKEYAQTALKLAYCDGPPYYYKVAYHEAEAMLEKLK